VIGGAIGWAMRIVFTLVFGREAFGLGDIHMMAAAGCVAGWPVVLLGFVVTIFVALGAWLLTLPFKKTRAIPLVPWLALGYVVAVVHYESLLRFGPIRNVVEVMGMLLARNSQPVRLGGPL
jgi:leader peptidase (prepilin peptidase)/N-methyltransferase